MNTPIEWPVLLTVRGRPLPPTLEEMRLLHNQTAGSPPGVVAARALGDLSHVVFTPSLGSEQSTAKTGELLFLDVWVHPKGVMDFFSNENVVRQGARLFRSVEHDLWMPADGAFSYHLPAPRGKIDRFVGMIRGPIASPERSIALFRAADINGQRDARRRGLLSHQIFIKLSPPGIKAQPELLGLDFWCDFAGMTEHYNDPVHMGGLSGAFSGPPQPTVWEQAPGDWSEW